LFDTMLTGTGDDPPRGEKKMEATKRLSTNVSRPHLRIEAERLRGTTFGTKTDDYRYCCARY
jgi:hypothetical protein